MWTPDSGLPRVGLEVTAGRGPAAAFIGLLGKLFPGQTARGWGHRETDCGASVCAAGLKAFGHISEAVKTRSDGFHRTWKNEVCAGR